MKLITLLQYFVSFSMDFFVNLFFFISSMEVIFHLDSKTLDVGMPYVVG